ncbi:MAG: hypothetical protein QXJ02_04355 [Candidatus Bathyarchaeia archaeon]
MNLNKLGIATKTWIEQQKVCTEFTVTNVTVVETEERKAWTEAEEARNRAIGLIRKHQNC